MKILNKLARKLIREWVIATMPQMKVKAGVCRFNYVCHRNSVHDAVTDGQKEVAMCFFFDDDFPIIHFVNVNEQGEYTDNTLGNWCNTYKYYLVRHIEEDSFDNIQQIFNNYRKVVKKSLPFYVRWLSDYDG